MIIIVFKTVTLIPLFALSMCISWPHIHVVVGAVVGAGCLRNLAATTAEDTCVIIIISLGPLNK